MTNDEYNRRRNEIDARYAQRLAEINAKYELRIRMLRTARKIATVVCIVSTIAAIVLVALSLSGWAQ